MCPYHQRERKLLAAGDGKSARIAVVVHDIEGRVAHDKAAARELIPAVEGEAKLEHVDTADADLLEAREQLFHARLGAGDDGHLHHDVGNVALRQAHRVEHALLHGLGVEVLHAEANLLQPRVAQRSRHVFRQQVARGVHALVRFGEKLARAVEERDRRVEAQKRLASREPDDGETVFVGFGGAGEALFPWAALADELVVVRLVVVEAEIAVAVAPERGGKRFGAFVSRALDARFRDPAHADRCARVAELGAPFLKLAAQLGDLGIG